LTTVREGDIKIGIPKVSGGNIPEPFNENDERVIQRNGERVP
jgi:hypothetical protein